MISEVRFQVPTIPTARVLFVGRLGGTGVGKGWCTCRSRRRVHPPSPTVETKAPQVVAREARGASLRYQQQQGMGTGDGQQAVVVGIDLELLPQPLGYTGRTHRSAGTAR